MRIVFMGTPEVAASVLQQVAQYHEVCAVYTRVDKPAGRGHSVQYSPVKQYALSEGYSIEQPKSLKEEAAQEVLRAYNPDCIVVVAYGMILPQAVLDIPTFGAINVHASLLPAYRGAAPVQRALLDGVGVTGVTIMEMDAGLDTGAMLLRSEIPVAYTDTTYTMMKKIGEVGGRALLRTLAYYDAKLALQSTTDHKAIEQLARTYSSYHLAEGDILKDTVLSPEQQDDSQATYANKILKEEYNMEFISAEKLHHTIQAFTAGSTPSCYAVLQREGQKQVRVKLYLGKYTMQQHNHTQGVVLPLEEGYLPVACKEGIYYFSNIRPENKQTLSAEAFYQGYIQGRESYFITHKEE